MKGNAGWENQRALTAQDTDADQIAYRPLYRVFSGEILALVDLAGQLTDRELGWVLCENEG